MIYLQKLRRCLWFLKIIFNYFWEQNFTKELKYEKTFFKLNFHIIYMFIMQKLSKYYLFLLKKKQLKHFKKQHSFTIFFFGKYVM